MKTINYKWMGLLLPALLTACSSNEETIVPEPDTQVKVEIGTVAPSLNVKAAVNDEDWEGTTINVLGLAKNASTWNFSDMSTLFNNGYVAATVNSGAVVFNDGNHYYPDGNMQYTFYGYYPANVTPRLVSNNRVTATFDLDGTQDILFAKTVAPTLNATLEGYNASYFRDEMAQKPNLSFKHKLTRFTFEVFAGNQETVDTEDYQVEVASIKLVDAKADNAPLYDQATLTVAELTYAGDAGINNDGKLHGMTIASPASFTLKDASGVNAQAVRPTVVYNGVAQGTTMGESMMVLPNEGQNKFRVQITIRKVLNAEEEAYEEIIERDIVLSENKPFAVGSSYNVKLTVFGFTKVEVTASLEPWEKGEDISLPTIH